MLELMHWKIELMLYFRFKPRMRKMTWLTFPSIKNFGYDFNSNYLNLNS